MRTSPAPWPPIPKDSPVVSLCSTIGYNLCSLRETWQAISSKHNARLTA